MKIDVQPEKQYNLKSAYVEAPFDKAKAELEKEGYRIISLEENAKLRMQKGKNAFISQNGNHVQEAVIHDKAKGIFLTKYPIIIKNAEKATDCHRHGNEFFIDKEQTENALKDSAKFPKTENYSIPTDRFGEDEITDFAFGKIAKDYGLFLKDAGINEMPVWFASLKDKPFARQLWLRGRGSGSDLDGYGRYLDYNCRVRGVRESAEGAARKVLQEVYTPKQISKVLKELEIQGLEKQVLERLRE